MKYLIPSPAFRAGLAVLAASVVLGLASSRVSAQTGPELLLKPFPKELAVDANASASFQDTGHSKESGADFRLSIYESEGRVRLSPGDLASPRIGYSFTYLDIDSSIVGLPRRLIDQSIGFATPIAKYDNWIFGLSGAVGYAGDSFFGDGDGFYGRGTIGAFKQLSETDSLVFAIDYNGNRTYKPDVPLPGVEYIKRIQSNLLLTVGLPVTSVEWEPVDKVRVEFSYLLVDNVTARVGYEVAKGLEIFGAAGQRSEGFFIDGTPSNKDRILFQQRTAEVGVSYRTRDAGIGDQDLQFTGAIGYAWDGEFSTGFDQLNSRLLADVSDKAYVRFALQLRF